METTDRKMGSHGAGRHDDHSHSSPTRTAGNGGADFAHPQEAVRELGGCLSYDEPRKSNYSQINDNEALANKLL